MKLLSKERRCFCEEFDSAFLFGWGRAK